ncbi:MAG: Ldh family oxidoreductase [Pseudomonadota bacterium]
MTELRIEPKKLKTFGMDVLDQLGVPEEKAEICIDAYLFGSLRGLDTHGLFALLPRMVREIRAGMIDPTADISIVNRNSSTLLVDARRGLGPVSGFQSMKEAIELCRQTGLGGVSTYNCNHFGAASFYGFQAVREDFIGMTFGNATPRVAPYGGREGVHGTNPMSFVIPAGKHPPLAVDFATSASSAGKIGQILKKGGTIPDGWALDRDGNPTTDPEKALEGILLPMAGHKGYGLGLIVDILTGALAGSYCGKEVPPLKDLTTPYGCSSFMLVLDPACFAGIETFKKKVDGLIEDCITCPPMNGFKRVYYPGEMEAEEETKRTQNGIPFPEEIREKFFEGLSASNIKVSRDFSLLID